MKLPSLTTRNIVIAVLTLIGLVLLYRWIMLRVAEANAARYQNAIDNEISNGTLTYTLTQYQQYADKLEECMAYLGTDEPGIYAVMQAMNTTSDVLQLIKSFGQRNYYYWGGAAGLTTWIGKELNADEIARINDMFARKTINYKF